VRSCLTTVGEQLPRDALGKDGNAQFASFTVYAGFGINIID